MTTETKPRVLIDNRYHARKRADIEEIATLRGALNAAIALIDGIGRNVTPLVEERLEDELNEWLHELAAMGRPRRRND